VKELRQDRGEDGAHGLARSVGIERTKDHCGYVEAAVIAQRELVGRDLGGGVGRLRVERVGLTDGTVSGVP